MPSEDIKIILSAADNTKQAFNQLQGNMNDLKSKTGSVVNTIKNNWLGITAAIAGAAIGIKKAWDLAELAAQFQQSEQAFKTMVQGMGRDAEAEFARIRSASAGLIDEKTIIEASNRAMALGIPIERVAELMEIARAKARDMGTDVTSAFNDIVTGIGRASPMILDNLGITLKVGEANSKYAASIGKTVEQLSSQDKKQAILNATIEAGREALERHDLTVKTNLERMQEFTRTINDLKVSFGGLAAGFTSVFLKIFQFRELFDMMTAGTQENTALQLEKLDKEISSLENILKGKGFLGAITKKFMSSEEESTLQRTLTENIEKRQKLFETYFNVISAGKPTEIKVTPKLDLEEAQADYSKLQDLHSAAINNMKSKSEELKEVEKDIATTRLEFGELVSKIDQQDMSGKLKYYTAVEQLDKKHDMAMKLSGEDKISMLQEIARSWSGIAGEVIENNEVIVSSAITEYNAIKNIKQIEEEVISEMEKKQSTIQNEIQSWKELEEGATASLETIKDRIGDIAEKEVKIDIKINADEAFKILDNIESKLKSLNSEIDKKAKKIIEVKTKASPEMPFSEGIEYIKGKLTDLAETSRIVFDFKGLSSALQSMTSMSFQFAQLASLQSNMAYWGNRAAIPLGNATNAINSGFTLMNEMFNKQLKAMKQGNMSQNINFNIKGADPQSIAKEIDQILANQAKYGRSAFASYF